MTPRRRGAGRPRGRALKAALRRVTEAYAAFAAAGPTPGGTCDPKEFTAHHAACRAALAHLDLLQRVLRAMEGPEGGEVSEGSATLLARAREALAAAEEGPTEAEERKEPDGESPDCCRDAC